MEIPPCNIERSADTLPRDRPSAIYPQISRGIEMPFQPLHRVPTSIWAPVFPDLELRIEN